MTGHPPPNPSPPANRPKAWLELLRVARARLQNRLVARPLTACLVVTLIAAAGPATVEVLRAPFIPTIAAGNAASATIGLLGGRGMTVDASGAEAWRAVGAARADDLLALYRPRARRAPAQEPLPGNIVPMWILGAVFGRLETRWMVWLQIVGFAASAGLLLWGLWSIGAVVATASGLAWALCLPAWRLVLTPGYDTWTAVLWVAAVTAGLRWSERPGGARVLVVGLVCAVGLWFRAYFVLLCATLGVVVLVSAWRGRDWRQPLAYTIPIAISLVSLAASRPQADVAARVTRGAFWHNFYTGVGQFENPSGIVATDDSVRCLVERLDSGRPHRAHYYQYGARYNRLLADHARAVYRNHWPELVRNAGVRFGWALLPGMAPSRLLSRPGIHEAALAASVLVLIFAALGTLHLAAAAPRATAVLLAGWVAILPLCAYYLIPKVIAGVFFVHLTFAAIGLDRFVAEGAPSPRR